MLVVALSILGSAHLGAREDAPAARLLHDIPVGVGIYDLEFSAFGSHLAVVDYDGNLTILDAQFEPVHLVPGPSGYREQNPSLRAWNSRIRFTPDERHLLLGNDQESGRLGIFDPRSGIRVGEVRTHSSRITALAVSSSGGYVATASYGEVALWARTGSGRLREIGRLTVDNVRFEDLVFSPDNERLVAAAHGGVFFFRTGPDGIVAAGSLGSNDPGASPGSVNRLAYSPDGRWLALGTERHGIKIIERRGRTYTFVQDVVDPPDGGVFGIAFTPDSTGLFAVHLRESIVTARLNGDEWSFGSSYAPSGVYLDLAVSPEGDAVAAGTLRFRSVRGVLEPVEPVFRVWRIQGVEPSERARIAAILEGRISSVQRGLLTSDVARDILASADPELTAPRDMFETDKEFATRRRELRRHVAVAVRRMTEAYFGLREMRVDDLTTRLSGPLDDRGSYDVERERYTVPLLEVEATLDLPRDAARDLYRNWEDARVRVDRAATVTGYEYYGYALEHPTQRELYPLRMLEDPFTGTRLDPVLSRRPAIAAGPDLVLRDLEITGIYPSLYRSYLERPIGTVTAVNAGQRTISNLVIAVEVPPYTARQAETSVPGSLAIGETASVDFGAAFNRSLLDVAEGDTANAVITASYDSGDERFAKTITVPVRVLNRNAIRWDDDLKVTAFMSVTSPEVLRFANDAVATVDDRVAAAIPRRLQYAVQVFEAVRATGMRYVVDPNSAYETLSQDALSIDFLRFPTETLEFGAGDCDDLSVLYNTLLESVGVPTAFITTPGHLFVAFDTGLTPTDVQRTYSRTEDFIYEKGTAWIPVETTLLGDGFVEAWRAGAVQWRAARAAGTAGFFTSREGWATYEPAPVEHRSQATPAPADAVRTAYQREIDRFREQEVAASRARLEAAIDARREPHARLALRLGILYARYGYEQEARAHFERAISDSASVPALLNLASLLVRQDRPTEAVKYLRRARDIAPEDPRVYLALAVSHVESGEISAARNAFDELTRLRPELARRYPLFSPDATGGAAGRASDGRNGVVEQFLLEEWSE